jgi:hypothetical protein
VSAPSAASGARGPYKGPGALPPGNRIWRVDLPGGTVLQKVYGDKGGALAARLQAGIHALARVKSSPRARKRLETERALLRLWREAGIDVPADLTDRHPGLASRGDTLVLEFVDGVELLYALDGGMPDRARRDALLRRFAAAWGRRHALALDRGDARLLHGHGTMLHVLVAGDRLVTIDLEQTFHPRIPVPVLVAREIAAYLKSLAKRAPDEVFRRDLEVLVSAYPRREVLADAVHRHLDDPGLLWRLDRLVRRDRGRRSGKYRVLGMLREALATSSPG